MTRLLLALVFALSFGAPCSAQDDTVVVGSKNFTESVVLGEIMAQWIEARTDLRVERRMSLGGTLICWSALQAGEIDLYADYTGTAWSIILKEEGAARDPLRTFLRVSRRMHDEFGVRWLDPFGLDNTYALAMTETKAEELGIERISDLLEWQDELRAGFSIEFGNREDGLPGLIATYGLDFSSVAALEHGLAYDAIRSGSIDVMDVYATDGKLLRYELRLLEDDRGFFPPYNASPLLNGETAERHPEIEKALSELAFRIPDSTAQTLNYLVEAEGATAPAVARAFLESAGLVEHDPGRKDAGAVLALREKIGDLVENAPTPGQGPSQRSDFFDLLSVQWRRLLRLTGQHLALTLGAVLLAALFAIPLGVWITRRPRLREIVLGLAGVVQTIPSLALLAFMIPLLGLDVKAAVAALFLYAVLPILRNTYTGISGVDPDLVDAARGMGMRRREILMKVQLPLASRTILAGLRTSTVISLGVATLAAFIGAGGLGEPIVEGLYLNDTNLILLGAVPAALLAVFADRGLGMLETAIQPRPLR